MVEVTTLDEPLLPALLAFLRRVYPSPHKGDEAYFRWRFFEGPFGPSGAAYAIARDGKEIIGQLGALRDRLEGRGRSEDVLWLVDMIIAPEARNDLIGVRLVRKVQQSARTILLSGAGPHMEKFYVALGFKKLVGNRTLYLPIRASHVAPAKIPRGIVRSVDAALSLVRPHSVLGYLLSLAAGMRIEKDAVPNDPRIDLLLASEPEAVRCASTPAVRSWRARRPIGRHRIDLSLDREGVARGYTFAKWFRRDGGPKWIDVVDHAGEPGAVRTLAGNLAAEASREGLDFLRLRGLPATQRELRPLPLLDRLRTTVDEVFVWSRDPGVVRWISDGPIHMSGLASDRTDYGGDEWT